MPKGGAYVVTPVLEQGVASLSFMEGRRDRDISVYASKDSGMTWSLLRVFESEDLNTLKIYDREVNRLKLVNESSSDADIDNIAVTGFPEGTPPVVSTGEATEVGSSKATVAGSTYR